MATNFTCLLKSTQFPDLEGGWLTTHTTKGVTVFLDWKNPNSTTVLEQGLRDLYNQVPFDGYGLSRNVYKTLCSGECP
jgi:hypothetical protein